MIFAGGYWWLFLIFNIIGIFIYKAVLTKIESNFLEVIIRSFTIPNIILGYFKRPIPLYDNEDINVDNEE